MTNSPPPSFTPTASSTPTRTLTRARTATQTPTETATPTATPNELATHIARAATGSARKTPASQEFFRSPDGKWHAQIIVRACNATPTPNDWGYEELRVKNLATGHETLADSQGIWCDGLGAYGLKGYSWSDNSRFFYYTNARQGVPDGCGYWAKPYLAYDTQTGKTTYLDGDAISPDGKLLAAWGENEIVIWDFQRGEIARSPVVFQAIPGPMAWSPDGRALVYLQTTDYCFSQDSYLARLDAPDFKPTFAGKFAGQDFGSVRWQSQEELRLFTFPDDKEWRYLFATKKLEPLAATPQP